MNQLSCIISKTIVYLLFNSASSNFLDTQHLAIDVDGCQHDPDISLPQLFAAIPACKIPNYLSEKQKDVFESLHFFGRRNLLKFISYCCSTQRLFIVRKSSGQESQVWRLPRSKSWYTPPEKKVEPENHLVEKKNNLSNLHFCVLC